MLTDTYDEYIVDDEYIVLGLTDFFLDKYNLQSDMGGNRGRWVKGICDDTSAYPVINCADSSCQIPSGMEGIRER